MTKASHHVRPLLKAAALHARKDEAARSSLIKRLTAFDLGVAKGSYPTLQIEFRSNGPIIELYQHGSTIGASYPLIQGMMAYPTFSLWANQIPEAVQVRLAQKLAAKKLRLRHIVALTHDGAPITANPQVLSMSGPDQSGLINIRLDHQTESWGKVLRATMTLLRKVPS